MDESSSTCSIAANSPVGRIVELTEEIEALRAEYDGAILGAWDLISSANDWLIDGECNGEWTRTALQWKEDYVVPASERIAARREKPNGEP